MPPIVTVAPVRKFVPLIVSDVPPRPGPERGGVENGRRCENSDVLPEGSVAVAEMGEPSAAAMSVVTWNVPLPVPSVVTVAEPM